MDQRIIKASRTEGIGSTFIHSGCGMLSWIAVGWRVGGMAEGSGSGSGRIERSTGDERDQVKCGERLRTRRLVNMAR